MLEGVRMDLMLEVGFETDNGDKDGMRNSKHPSPGVEEGQELA